MPYFKYTGIDQNGKKVKGYDNNFDEQALRIYLKGEGIMLKSCKVLKEKRKSSFLSLSSKVSNAQFLSFCQQLAIMLKAGISIKDCLESFRHQNYSTYFKNIISDVYEDVLKGVLLSDAFRKHPKIFPSYFCSMVYVGELSGNLPDVLVSASEYYSNDIKIKRRIKSSMIYPIFLLIVIVAIFFLLMILVVPSFKDMIESNGAEVPAITRITLGISDFITGNLPFILLGLFVVIGGLILFFRSKIGKKIKATILFHIPVIARVQKNSVTSRFCTSLCILLRSGMQVLDCMSVMPTIIDNPYFEVKFSNVVKDLNHGKKLSRCLDNVGLFPPMLIQMTTVGENSSSLEEVYSTVGEYYQDELNASITRATGMLEPIVIVIMGVIVLMVLLAVMLPMFAIMNSF